ncbi:hypothetical protein GFPCMMHI_03416 [Ensifer adhaerens]|nr:hypothetical protein [Ensifer adhaerens]
MCGRYSRKFSSAPYGVERFARRKFQHHTKLGRPLWQRLPRAVQFLLIINNTLMGRVLLERPLNAICFTISEERSIAVGNRQNEPSPLAGIKTPASRRGEGSGDQHGILQALGASKFGALQGRIHQFLHVGESRF